MRTLPFCLHLLGVSLPLFVLVHVTHPAAQAGASVFAFFGAFALLHDAMHASLRLPRWLNDVVLACAGVMIGVSGHATRLAHLRHHARPLADDDLEGRGARFGVVRSLLLGPASYAALPAAGWRLAPWRIRRWQLGEWLGVALFYAVSMLDPRARVLALTVLIAQLTIQLWASYLPHRPPAALLRMASALAWTRLPLVTGFVFHDLHHARPQLHAFELQPPGVANARTKARSQMKRWAEAA